ncbi:MAG: FAD-dependent oxidoreductase [Coriobacteriales bacterium]|jgi:UDP-galactopyranose mutase|nr:FAD-dependent oxidoreductase [Coriobacteriales bacterium]
MDLHMLHGFDAIVIGAGFAGSVVARELAERGDKKVAVLERRPHIGGNAFDRFDSQGVLIHEYGPHIYHTNSGRVHNYLSRFADWNGYSHEVLADIHGQFIPVPFNMNSIAASFDKEKAETLKTALLDRYPIGTKVTILELREQSDILLKELADYVYEHVFVHYTMKQWGLTPEEIDPAVTARVPVLVDIDNRYFQDQYQGLPVDGYTKLFEGLLDHPGIEIFLGVDATDGQVMRFVCDKGSAGGDGDDCYLNATEAVDTNMYDQPSKPFQEIIIAGQPYRGLLVFTGALDELAGYRFGQLPYRSLDFVYRNYPQKHMQPCGTINYTVSENYTRTTEYSWLTKQDIDVTTIAEEYPCAFTDPAKQIPYYPILPDQNQAAYNQYCSLFTSLKNFYLAGRLAEYRYYNMDQIVLRALELADEILAAR